MKTFTYTIKNEIGVHVRPAGQLSTAASKYISKVVITNGDKSAEATQILAVMSLGIKCGDEITVNTIGEDEERAAEGIKKFLNENF
ncbi:MAG: HPr family phosphocarrier protein [Saccharofermentans sp.]|nr:HPr family phosphocarrier protein [Saccharofermentans sp.]